MPAFIEAVCQFLYYRLFGWIVSQPWPVAIALSLLVLFLALTYWLLTPRILRRQVIVLRTIEQWRKQPIQTLQLLGRLVLGFVVLAFSVAFALTGYERAAIQRLTNRLTATEKSFLLASYVVEEFEDVPAKFPAVMAQVDPWRSVPDEFRYPLSVHAQETLIELGLIVDRPYTLEKNPVTNTMRPTVTQTLTRRGYKVGEYLYSRNPFLPHKASHSFKK